MRTPDDPPNFGQPGDSPAEVTAILSRASTDPAAAAALLPVVYQELRSLAKARLSQFGGAANTLEPTALVHEAYVRLVGKHDPGWNGRGHFFAAAAQAMRNILVDSARRKGTLKRGGQAGRINIDEINPDDAVIAEPRTDILALDAALTKLAELDDRKARIVMLRYFGGLSPEETALALNISVLTVFREWKLAKAILLLELEPD